MTQNQLAYQANLVKARGVADRERQTDIKMSEHLYDYPLLRKASNRYTTSNWGDDVGLKQWDVIFNKNPLVQGLAKGASALIG